MIKEIKTRRSIRKYIDKSVENEKITQLLESAILAPSGSNIISKNCDGEITNHIPISLIFTVTSSTLPSISVPSNFPSFSSLTIFPSRINIIRSVRAATFAS